MPFCIALCCGYHLIRFHLFFRFSGQERAIRPHAHLTMAKPQLSAHSILCRSFRSFSSVEHRGPVVLNLAQRPGTMTPWNLRALRLPRMNPTPKLELSMRGRLQLSDLSPTCPSKYASASSGRIQSICCVPFAGRIACAVTTFFRTR